MAAKSKKATKKAVKKASKKVDLKRLTPAGRRVAIAQDVIASLNSKRFRATCGTYVESDVDARGFYDEKKADEYGVVEVDVKSILLKNLKTCDVCAKGAMFVASVERFNKLKLEIESPDDNVLDQFGDNEEVCEHLTNYFDQDQLDLIEKAFEGEDFIAGNGEYPDWNDDFYWTLLGYTHRFPEPAERMTGIMRNIVRNNGKFVVSPAELFLD